MQNSLFGEEKDPVELKESYGGFSVVFPDHIQWGDKPKHGRVIRWGSEIVKQYPCWEKAREEFEREVRRDYNRGVEWLKSKFKDSRGKFWLDGIEIDWKLEANYMGLMYHIKFNSYVKSNPNVDPYILEWNGNKISDNVPNLMTSTGYKSHFTDQLDFYDDIETALRELIDLLINTDEMGKPLKKKKDYKLEFKDTGYRPSKQNTLMGLKGGNE